MTYGRGLQAAPLSQRNGAGVSHSAELVRGNFSAGEGPSSAPSGHLLPKGRRGASARSAQHRPPLRPLSPRGEDVRP